MSKSHRGKGASADDEVTKTYFWNKITPAHATEGEVLQNDMLKLQFFMLIHFTQIVLFIPKLRLSDADDLTFEQPEIEDVRILLGKLRDLDSVTKALLEEPVSIRKARGLLTP